MSRVLVVNDVRLSIKLVALMLHRRGIEAPVEALTLDEAEKKFTEHRATLRVIVMDGYVDKPLECTVELVRQMQQTAQTEKRQIHFIGFSSDANDQLLAAGCEAAFDPTTQIEHLTDYVASIIGSA